MTKQTWLRTLTMAAAASALIACSDDDGETMDTVDGGDMQDGGDQTPDSGGETDSGDTDGGDETPAEKTIAELVVENPDFEALEAAVTLAELVDTLNGAGPFTVFAPTNAAFTAALAELGVEASEIPKDQLTALLTYHVVSGEVLSTDLETGPVATVSGLSAWVNTADGVKVNDVDVVEADIQASNGVIHVVDKVILPPDIVQFATYAGFTSLTGAVASAGLVDALSFDPEMADAKLTVFAPTNDAFGELASVPTGDALRDVLLYHVVSGEVLSTDLMAGTVPTLLEGATLDISLEGGATVNGANVGPVDLRVTNGVIHVVDAVLIPET